jgi:ribosome recycling factor
MALPTINSERRSAAVRTEDAALRAERVALKAIKADIQTIIDTYDGMTANQQRGAFKDLCRYQKRVIAVLLG